MATLITPDSIRASYDTYKLARRAGWERYPIRTWGPFEYIVYSDIDLRLGPQTITVIDITDRQGVARFACAWPEQGWDEESCRKTRRFALLYTLEEGMYDWLVMTEDPSDSGCLGESLYYTDGVHAAELTIFVGSAASIEIDQFIGDIAWAVAEARAAGWQQQDEQIADTIRAAARRGAIVGSRQGASRRWYFDKNGFRDYLQRAASETRGRPSIEDLITGGADVHTIQHTLAAMARESGHIPHGQLWQPCEVPGCDNEPVCLNCLMCDTHCRCEN